VEGLGLSKWSRHYDRVRKNVKGNFVFIVSKGWWHAIAYFLHIGLRRENRKKVSLPRSKNGIYVFKKRGDLSEDIKGVIPAGKF